jgi:hypothetical protein
MAYITWLASYPKSGNTWFRAFLTALLNPGATDIDINALLPTPIASSRQLFDDMAGVTASDLTADEIDLLRPSVYRQDALESEGTVYHKVHDAYTLLPTGEPLFPSPESLASLYFIRNPLDVAVSFAHHLHTTTGEAIAAMNNPAYAFCEKNNRLHNQLRQRLLTWSGHVRSWTEQQAIPVKVLRYEDMLARPLETFSEAVAFIRLEYTREQIQSALDRSSFDRLKQQENEKGFSERNAKSGSFFRKGVAGDWKNHLNDSQVQQIIAAHGEVMGKFGYL